MNKMRCLNTIFIVIVMISTRIRAEQPVTKLKKLPKSIEEVTKEIPITFISFSFSQIIFKYNNGEIVNTFCDFDGDSKIGKLYSRESLKKQNKPRKMYLSYSFAKGVLLVDKIAGKTFKLPGHLAYHPIDYARDKLMSKFCGTSSMCYIHGISGKAWDIELNRIYKYLGGAKNKHLLNMQRKWMIFRDAKIKFIREYYSNVQGTMWLTITEAAVTGVTRTQVEDLQYLVYVKTLKKN